MSQWMFAHPWGSGLIGAAFAALGVFFLKLAERQRSKRGERWRVE